MERRKVLVTNNEEGWFLGFGIKLKRRHDYTTNESYYENYALVEMYNGNIKEFNIYDIEFLNSDKALEEKELMELKRREELYSNPIIDIINLFKKLFKKKCQ